MDIHFDAALRLINMENYDAAVRNLEQAIEAEEGKGDTKCAMEYTCVLGELLANMGETERARGEFNKVLGYCTITNSLPEQRKIAKRFIDEFDGKLPSLSPNGKSISPLPPKKDGTDTDKYIQ